MIRYLLDTNIVRFALRARPSAVLERLAGVRPDQVAVSVITACELRFGAARSHRAAHYHALIDTLLARIDILPFEPDAAAVHGRVRSALEGIGKPIGPLDTLIAAHALASGRVLVTNNTREFQRVDGLVLDDWSRP